MAVSVSVPVRESLERTGVSVVAPEAGRGPVRTLIATGPFGVNCAPVSKVTPGQSARVCAPAGAARQSAASAVRRRRRPIDRFEGSGARGAGPHSLQVPYGTASVRDGRLYSLSLVDGLSELLERNRAWAAATVAADPQFFAALAERQAPGVPVDRVLGQPRPREPDRRARARRRVRPPQRRQRRRPHRPQLPVGAAVRGRRPRREARDRVRPLRLRRRPGGARGLASRVDRQLAAPRDGRPREARRRARLARPGRRGSTGCASSTSSSRS